MLIYETRRLSGSYLALYEPLKEMVDVLPGLYICLFIMMHSSLPFSSFIYNSKCESEEFRIHAATDNRVVGATSANGPIEYRSYSSVGVRCRIGSTEFD